MDEDGGYEIVKVFTGASARDQTIRYARLDVVGPLYATTTEHGARFRHIATTEACLQGRTDPDDATEPPAHPVAEPSDLWLLGRHRLLCGDSTVATDVERVLGGVAPHLMVTDPPTTALITTRLGVSAAPQR